MKTCRISDNISYIPATEDPLSADIGIIRDGTEIWLYDVGNDPQAIARLTGKYNVVLSHFHKDHTGNLQKLHIQNLYVSDETQRHTGIGTVVNGDLYFGALHLFPLPSSHCKGCLGLEVEGRYAFVGDALYCKTKNGAYTFSVQLVHDLLAVLKRLTAPDLLVSHFPGMVRPRAEVIAEFEALYAMRQPGNNEILLRQ